MPFIPGLKLSGLFYTEVVKPILDRVFPDLRYTACLIGTGSEVLGFDTEMSTDHHWGPRLMMFLTDDDLAQYGEMISDTLSHQLPKAFRGYSTHFTPPSTDDNGVQILEILHEGAVNHRVELYTLADFTTHYLGITPTQDITYLDWLTMPAQKLRTMIEGAVYHDSLAHLTTLRERLMYYPHDIWLYLLLANWVRIGQEEHLMGRAGYVGDELGSRLIGARLVHDLMSLCFLLEKQYAPYSKWFGTAFRRLACAGTLTPHFQAILDAQTWQQREQGLIPAYEYVAQMHNRLNITPPVETLVQQFHNRPFMVSRSGEINDALCQQISDPAIKHLAEQTPIGAVEQFSTSTDVLSRTRITRRAKALYE